jgi:DNA polymerase family A
MERLQGYSHIWVFDFEYVADPGETPEPVCLAAVDLVTGTWIKLWRKEMLQPVPFATDDRSLFVCFSGAGDIGCFLRLGWSTPRRLIDLYPEIRQQLYDRDGYKSPSLINAARLLHLPCMESEDKDAARDLIINRGFTEADRDYLLDYCAQDVELTRDVFARVYPVITDSIECWNGCLIRGRTTIALAHIDRTGIPIDSDSLELASTHWEAVKRRVIAELDTGGVYDGVSFRAARFGDLLHRLNIPWPRLATGALDLEDDTFRQQARIHGGVIANIREVRHTLGQMCLNNFTVGKDGRNRVYLNPYGAVTGRNQPSNSRFIFGSARWSRSFIKPSEGRAIAYVDWASQEIAIGAALSGDAALWEDYRAGDVYMAFAIRTGLAPADATKETHGSVRKQCKATVLGLGYGLTEHGLAPQLNVKLDTARRLILLHREAYSVFHKWVEQQANAGSLGLPLRTVFGWERRMKPGSRINLRSLKNFYMQATGAEMLRIALCELTEAGIAVCCPVHDAVLVEAPLEELDKTLAATQQIMGDVSEVVLGDGYRIPTDFTVTRYPDVYVDEDAGDLYAVVMRAAREAALAGSGP